MARKGTPEYDEWYRKYLEKRGKKVETKEPSAPRKKKTVPPEQPSLFKKEIPKDLLPKGAKRVVHSKSQNKDITVEIIRFSPENGKYLVNRSDGKFLYYAPSELKEITQETKSSFNRELKQGESVAVVPPGSLSEKIEKTLEPVVADLNYEGLQIDKDEVNALISENEEQLAKAQATINSVAGHLVNVNSPRDVASLLYDAQGLPRVNGNSTSEDTLVELAQKTNSELPGLIMAYRKSSKMLKSYLYKLRDLSEKGDGKIYNVFGTGALSGRFTTKHNPVAVEVPDNIETEKKIYFPEDLEEIGLPNICPL